MGGRQLSPFSVATSIVMSTISAIMLLGQTAEVYQYGSSFVIVIVAIIIGKIVANIIFVPLFYNLGITSVFEVNAEHRHWHPNISCYACKFHNWERKVICQKE